jgi:hypothetical protein
MSTIKHHNLHSGTPLATPYLRECVAMIGPDTYSANFYNTVEARMAGHNPVFKGKNDPSDDAA